MSSMIQAVIDSVLPSKPQPVVPNEGLIRAMDLSFLGLLLTLLALLVITQGNLHVLALMLVAICLWISVRWFVAELARMNHLNKPVEISSALLSTNDPQPSSESSTNIDKLKSS
ncbi:hypothetical protein PtA15_16A164 [Puccinia triticina]|uniref:Uncharacterized protein n=1 Tax=Puccinia triticina TaxID=208348 RepID=A0ABY7D3R4_9BASI|nr:uncharacterized protein PtA15_16A164 [Puccinia triticina]WAQ92258.1 hypothetical protein PtA15_16A164 [Puccinia triticina]